MLKDMRSRLPELDLRQLHAFLIVAEELHFGRAAQQLGIAQPPLSQQIQRLEKRVGYSLFNRGKRRIELTATGRAFVDVARRVLNQVSDGLEDTRRAGRGEIGRLRLSFAASTGLTVLPKIVGNFRKRYPGVELDLREQTTTPSD